MYTVKPVAAIAADIPMVTPRQPYLSEMNDARIETAAHQINSWRDSSEESGILLTYCSKGERWDRHELGLGTLIAQTYDDTRQEAVGSVSEITRTSYVHGRTSITPSL